MAKDNGGNGNLNDAIVRALPVPASGNRIHYFVGAKLGGIEAPRGFGVRVTAAGARSFVLNYRHDGRECRYTIGRHPEWTAQDAVREARKLRQRVDRGENPLDARQPPAPPGLTLDDLIDEWGALHLPGARHRAEAARAIRKAYKRHLRRPAGDLTQADAVNTLHKIQRDGARAMAGKTYSYAKACFTWALRNGKVAANPFAGLSIAAGSAPRERTPADDEVRAIWAAAGTLGHPWGAFYQLLTLTLQRRDTVAGMRWSELDIERRVWSIPGARMKMNHPHDVHLTDAALDVLRSIPRIAGSDFVLTTTGRTPVSGYSKAKRALDAALGAPIEPWRGHDLRRSGVSALARLGFDSVVVDLLLAHQPTRLSAVARIYQRHDFARERAAALDAWAAHVTGRGGGAKIVPLRPARGA